MSAPAAAFDDVALAERMKQGRDRILAELRKLIVGQDDVVEQVLISLFVGGNSIITGVPGLAKTLIVHTLAQVLDLKFSRIQFTPDLMPSDITGTDIIQEDPETGRRQLVFTPGPDLRQHRARGRDQPHAAQDAVRAARGHAGAPRHRAGQDLRPARSRSSSSPPRTRSSWRAPTRCPRRSSTGSCSTSSSTTCPQEQEMEVVAATTAIQDLRFERTVTGADIVAFQALVRRVPVADEVIRYAVDARPHQPALRDRPARVREEVGRIRRQRPRRAVPRPGRQGARADAAAATTSASTTSAPSPSPSSATAS